MEFLLSSSSWGSRDSWCQPRLCEGQNRFRSLRGWGRAAGEVSRVFLGFVNPNRDVPARLWMGLGSVGGVPVPVLGRAAGVK